MLDRSASTALSACPANMTPWLQLVTMLVQCLGSTSPPHPSAPLLNLNHNLLECLVALKQIVCEAVVTAGRESPTLRLILRHQTLQTKVYRLIRLNGPASHSSRSNYYHILKSPPPEM